MKIVSLETICMKSQNLFSGKNKKGTHLVCIICTDSFKDSGNYTVDFVVCVV